MTALNMAQQGLFGEVLHGAGGYIHNLEPYWDEYQGNWRLDFNQDHRGDVYATHGFGPICQAMNIHRGDRLQTLVAFDTKSVNGLKLVQEKMGLDECANGDYTITLLSTANGKMIEIHHNVMTPRPYDRKYQLTVPRASPTSIPSRASHSSLRTSARTRCPTTRTSAPTASYLRQHARHSWRNICTRFTRKWAR